MERYDSSCGAWQNSGEVFMKIPKSALKLCYHMLMHPSTAIKFHYKTFKIKLI